jgi:hypothetical protein
MLERRFTGVPFDRDPNLGWKLRADTVVGDCG